MIGLTGEALLEQYKRVLALGPRQDPPQMIPVGPAVASMIDLNNQALEAEINELKARLAALEAKA